MYTSSTMDLSSTRTQAAPPTDALIRQINDLTEADRQELYRRLLCDPGSSLPDYLARTACQVGQMQNIIDYLSVCSNQLNQQVAELRSKLPQPDERDYLEVMALRKQGYTIPEIAEKLGIKVSAVRSRIGRHNRRERGTYRPATKKRRPS